MKLTISEDTCCIPSKTSYMDEDGYDKNGIYYFGKKPDKPINWRDYKTNKLNKESKHSRMTERIHDNINIPPCPRKELNKRYKSEWIDLKNPDGVPAYSEFQILFSKNDAKHFINSLLFDAQFPMAESQAYLNDYIKDKQLYIEQMKEFYENGVWLYDSEGQSIGIQADGKFLAFYGDYDDAVKAISLRNIEQFIMSDSWGEVCYNAYIVFEQYSDDPEDGNWRVSANPTDYLEGSYSDYRWQEYKNSKTYIQIPEWADSLKDIIVK